MTKEDLARYRSLGFEFDEFYDTIAVETKPELAIKVIGVKTEQAFHIVNLAFTLKHFKSKNTILTIKSITKVIDNTINVPFEMSKNIAFTGENHTFDFKIPINLFNDYVGQSFKAFIICDGIVGQSDAFMIGEKKVKKEVEKKTCYCNRDFTEHELKNIIVTLRKENGYKKLAEVLFDEPFKEKLENVTFNGFTNNINAIFSKYKISKCIHKIHFIAQTYHESQHFRVTYENRTTTPENYEGGIDFQGRGIKQITHDYNYLEYYDKVKGTTFFQDKYNYKHLPAKNGFVEGVTEFMIRKKDPDFGESLLNELKIFAKRLSTEIDAAFDSSGWFWDKNNINKKAESDNVYDVTKAVNGNVKNPNGLDERTKYTKQLKKIMNYEKCTSNN